MNTQGTPRFSENVTPNFYFGGQPDTDVTLTATEPVQYEHIAPLEFRTEKDPQPMDEVWKDFYFGELDQPELDPDYLVAMSDKIPDRSDTSFEDMLESEFADTEPWIEPAPKDETEEVRATRELAEQELLAAQDFIIEATRVFDDAYMGNNSAERFLKQADFSLEKVGIGSSERTQDIAHQSRYMAFHLAGRDFMEESCYVEETYNQRATEPAEWPQVVERAVARIDADEELAKKIYTALELFTEDPYERHVAVSVIALTLAEIAHWESRQGVPGEIINKTRYHLQRAINAMIESELTKKNGKPTKWASTIAALEAEFRNQPSNAPSKA